MPFAIGDRVRILNRDYRGAKATVVNFETNLLGMALVMVRLDAVPEYDEGEYVSPDPCFFPNEVEKL